MTRAFYKKLIKKFDIGYILVNEYCILVNFYSGNFPSKDGRGDPLKTHINSILKIIERKNHLELVKYIERELVK